MTILYKICPAALWKEAERTGVFRGSEADRRDGFIHFSDADQVVETAAKHFAGHSSLLLVSVDATRLGERLRWEQSRGGALFPHLYADLDVAAVTHVEPLLLGPDGRHVFPPLEVETVGTHRPYLSLSWQSPTVGVEKPHLHKP